MKLLELIQQADLNLLYVLNVKLQNPFMDRFFLFVTQMHKSRIVMWGVVPVIVGYLFYIYRLAAIRPILALALTVAVADTVAYRGIKSFVDRQRPFQNSQTASWLRKVGEAHGPSFPSNHAANCFAGAYVLAWYFRRRALMFYSLAIVVSVSRVSLGLHWPSDVIAGASLGIIVGWLVTSKILSRSKGFARKPSKAERASRRYNTDWNWRKKSKRLRAD